MASFRIMSFNIRGSYVKDGDNVWPNRMQLNMDVIHKYAPDVIGFQELQNGNEETYETGLPEYAHEKGPKYNNKEPHCYPSIYWKKDRFDFVDKGEFWLSRTPDVFSADWDTACIRSALWVVLRCRESGVELLHLNTHLDHISDRARVEGAKVVVAQLDKAPPVDVQIVTGDFNCDAHTPGYQTFIDAGFVDAFTEAGLSDDDPEAYTFHGFEGRRLHSGRIDWILLRDGKRKARTLSSAIIKDQAPPIYPSDHYPIIADIAVD